MRKFDTKVQHIKYKVLREVARFAWEDKLLDNILDIPQIIIPGKKATMRCCVYKERAIVGERVKIALGGDKSNPNVIEVIEIACDECPVGGYEVTNACRGCLAHSCEDVCKFGAITFDGYHVAHIDKSKCRECGACAKACPYTAIVSRKRPCENACKVKAISMNDDFCATIDNSKCIQCGACAYQCPFGAITDKSYIVDAINMLKGSQVHGGKDKVFAIVAPAIASQLTHAKLGQVITGLKQLGFTNVVEAALGADMVALAEAQELAEKGILTSSCCPAFVKYIKQAFPQLTKHISHNLSPMATLAKYIKGHNDGAKVIFVGPCTAKKAEAQLEEVKPYVDCVITFAELQALFDSKDMDLSTLEESNLDDASSFGRIFAKSGGLTQAASQAMAEQGIDFEIKPVVCDGIEACRMALLKLNKGILNGNFIEGMACVGGCIGGAGCLTHTERNIAKVDKHSQESTKKTITESVENIE